MTETAQAVNGTTEVKPVLINADGTPTPDGWRRIGAAFRAEMPSQTRPGRGGMNFSYIDARDVQDRLDGVIGPGNWSTTYRVLDVDRAIVECTLTVFGIDKADVGYPNDASKPEQEALKSAYSDAFKRAAVHWGIGRFLYRDSP